VRSRRVAELLEQLPVLAAGGFPRRSL